MQKFYDLSAKIDNITSKYQKMLDKDLKNLPKDQEKLVGDIEKTIQKLDIQTVRANNVVGKVTRTAGSTTADLAVFASGTTTNVSTSFKVNDALAIDPGEIVVITNLAASATVLSLTIEPTK